MVATRSFIASAPTVAQVNTIAVGGTAATSQIYSCTINDKTLGYTALVSDSNATIAAALQAILALSFITEFQEVTWTVLSNVITGTMKNAGQTFANTSSATGTGTLVTATAVANSGPSDISVATNWSGATLPATGDFVVFENNSVNACYGLGAFAGVVFASVTQMMSYTGQRGLPAINASGYQEYRTQAMQHAASAIAIGDGTGSGSGLTKDDCQANQTVVNIHGTGNSAVNGSAAYTFMGTHAANVVNITKGSLDVAYFAGAVATIATLNQEYQTNVQSDAVARLGAGCTLTTINKSGGTLEINSAVTTLTQLDGITTIIAGAIATFDNLGGTVYQQGNGTMTAVVAGSGTVDFSRGAGAIAVTTMKIYGGVTLMDPTRRVTWTNPINLEQCSIPDVTIDLGTNIALAITAAS
jgi:hypothetical protein